MDSTPLRAKGGVWRKKHREQGRIPHSTIDTEAGWSKSGYHGWWYGWKLHLACAVSVLWIPLAAELTVANTDDAAIAPVLLAQLPAAVRYILGDTHYNTPDMQHVCQGRGWWLVASRRGKYPHTDSGVEVRRIFHKLRSQSIEPFNGLFKNVFEWVVKSRSNACGARRCSSWVRCCCISWSCSINSNSVNLWASALKPFCGPLDL